MQLRSELKLPGTLASLDLSDGARQIRRIVLEQSKRAKVGHIGSALCIAEMVWALYGKVLNVGNPNDNERDRFILGKGHAALAFYAACHLKGWISQEELDTFCGDDTMLGVHPEHAFPYVDFSTGSLGQGITFGCGAALAARLQHSARRVFVLMSDAECNEGAVWEAVMFAAHHRLSNLTVLVDCNGQQALGYTNEVLDLSPLSAKWSAFGWDAIDVDGHDTDELVRTLDGLDYAAGRPHVLICHTTFGKGVSFMEKQIKWHYSPMSDAEYQLAISEVSGA